VVAADGIEFSTITVTIRDINNQPLAGRTISLASSRGILDMLTQPLNPTDVNGVTTGEIRSINPGITQVLTTDVAETVLLNDQPDVTFSLGEVLQLTKTVSPDRASVGDVVTYTIEIQNTTVNTISGVRISDTPAPVLAYVAGTARLDGVPIVDPAQTSPLFFDIGDVLPLGDANGNGVADPGESGYQVLTYSMIVGAGARAGNYSNVALAVALCDLCALSDPATAVLEIVADPIFDLGTIIGKVFQDLDGDGWQDSGEVGIGGAMVALDNGVYSLTDSHGRFHFPAVKPGQRMVKLNVGSISGNARTTGKNRQVLSVTPGLLAKANFGVMYDIDTESIGAKVEYGLQISTAAEVLPDRIAGSASDLSLLVNGVRLGFADGDVVLTNTDANSIIHMGENGEIEPLQFTVGGQIVGQDIDDWTLRIWRDDDDNVKSIRGGGLMPGELLWSDVSEIRELLLPGRVYFYQLEALIGDARVTSRRSMFGVNRTTSIDLELRGGAFAVNSHELTPKARRLLSDAAKIMREHPDETIRIYGHTDSTGTRHDNKLLSEARANSAFEYLVTELELPPDRFSVKGFGEDSPVASNASDTGRELNRRVEIVGELTTVERARMYETRTNELVAAMNGMTLDIDASGQFSQTLDVAGTDTVDLHMINRIGQSIQTTVSLPRLHLKTLVDGELQYFAADDPRRATPGPEPEDAMYSYQLAGQTDSGNIVAIDNTAVPLDIDGKFRLPLRLQSGENRYVLSVKNANGLVRYANLNFTASTSIDGEPVIAVVPIPELVLQLPPDGIPMRHENLVVQGFTAPGNSVVLNEVTVEVDEAGHFVANIQLRPGRNEIVARVTDPRGYSGVIRRDVDFDTDSLFIMALADGKISQLKRTGNLAAAGATTDSETVTEGRVALYLKGTILGKYLITAAFDTGQNEISELFSDLDAIENDRLITNIDPDTVYPVYGDDSTLVYDTDSQGKLYLSLKGEQLDAVVGNYALSFTDTELARIDQVPVRDEISATGGSLYFLSHTDVVEGSEQVSLLVHDQHTGLLLQRINQQRNVDYDVKYREGRLWFRRPVSSVIDDTGLIGTNLLAGNPITIQVQTIIR
jgi:uncharacterized repeat protein (TIGR01451 family)